MRNLVRNLNIALQLIIFFSLFLFNGAYCDTNKFLSHLLDTVHFNGSPEESLKKNTGRWFKYYDLSKRVFWNENKAQRSSIKVLVEKITGKKVKHISFYRNEPENDGSYWERLTIRFKNSFPSLIKIEIFYNDHNNPGGTYIQAYNNEEIIFFQAWLDVQCNLIRAKIWDYNERNLLWRQKSLDESGNLTKIVYANRRVMPLEEIYASCKNTERPLEEILQVSRRLDRTLVTILDSGVDYNHPEIAYKIPRPSRKARQLLGPAIQKAKDLIFKLTKERDKLKERSNISEYTDKFSELNIKINENINMLKNISIGWDFEEDDNEPYDYDNFESGILGSINHGTHIAGIVTQGSDDIAILPIRRPVKKAKKDYDAIEFAHQKGSYIVNISVTFDNKEDYKYLDKAIKNHPDMLFVVAAGNKPLNIDKTASLAALNHPNMIVVASVDDNGKLSAFSGYGKVSVDVTAKGENIISIEPEAGLGAKTGTSQATPFVTRIAAKISFINPRLNPAHIIEIICNSVDKNDCLKSKIKYAGIVNEKRALELARKTLL